MSEAARPRPFGPDAVHEVLAAHFSERPEPEFVGRTADDPHHDDRARQTVPRIRRAVQSPL